MHSTAYPESFDDEETVCLYARIYAHCAPSPGAHVPSVNACAQLATVCLHVTVRQKPYLNISTCVFLSINAVGNFILVK